MIYHLLIAAGGIAGLSLGWLGIQILLRRQNPQLAPDGDVIGDRAHCHEHDCEGCAISSSQCEPAGETRRLAEGNTST